MITDNDLPLQLPQMADKCWPMTDTEAESRICESLARSGDFGLANLLFHNYHQLCTALQGLGWHVDLPVYIDDRCGTTWIGRIQKGKTELRMVVHSYQGEALVINVGPVKNSV